MTEHQYAWRGQFDDRELNALHAAAFTGAVQDHHWRHQVATHSLGWVTAREAGALIGFVNVAWDGGIHAFLLDTIVDPDRARRGVGTRLVAVAAAEARAAGCHWLHVDFDATLRPFYLEACGFEPTAAGLMRL